MQPAIHDPRANLTPSQRHEAQARRERLDRLQKSARLLSPKREYDAPAPDKTERPPTMAEWAERQKKIHTPAKELWFSIECEIDAKEQPRPLIDDIIQAVARHYEVSRADILSARRTAVVVRPRQVAMYQAKTLTLRSLPEIGRRMGQRDHTTILSGVRKITRLLLDDADLAEEVAFLESQLMSRVRA